MNQPPQTIHVWTTCVLLSLLYLHEFRPQGPWQGIGLNGQNLIFAPLPWPAAGILLYQGTCTINKISALLPLFTYLEVEESNKFTQSLISQFLAHLSQRLTGELIVYPCSGVRPSSVRRPQFQRSSPLKLLGQSKPNFMWSILRKGERKFI